MEQHMKNNFDVIKIPRYPQHQVTFKGDSYEYYQG